MLLLIVAAQISDKHEAAPTAKKPPKEFRETIVIGSASSWNKITLTLFHVAFYQDAYSDLRGFLDPKYYDPPSNGEQCHEGSPIVHRTDYRLL
jgi:hypothetical protein